MCVPGGAAGGAGMGMSLAAGALGAFGQIQQGNAQAAAANYSATTALQAGQSAVDAARINAQQIYRTGDQLEGQARASDGADGINPGSGSALANQGDIGRRTGQNVAAENYNADLTAYGYRNQSMLDTAQAGFDKQAATISAASTLLGGASQVSSKWASWQQATPEGSAGASALASGGSVGSGWGSNGGSVMPTSWSGAWGS